MPGPKRKRAAPRKPIIVYNPSTDPNRPLLGARAMAAELGISPKTIYQMHHTGRLAGAITQNGRGQLMSTPKRLREKLGVA